MAFTSSTQPGAELQETFASLLHVQGPRLRRLATSYARGSDAADLLQEMLLQIWRSLPRFRQEASAETWAYRIALNTALTHLRKEIKRRAVETDDPETVDEDAGGHVLPGGDEDRMLDDFLNSLSPVDRAVMLGYLEGLTHEQLADVVGCSAGAIAVRINRLKAAFKRRYMGG